MSNFKVADSSLAAWGRKEIEIAEVSLRRANSENLTNRCHVLPLSMKCLVSWP